MIADTAHKQTDKILSALEKRLRTTYSKAASDARDKFTTYMAAFSRKDEQHKADVASGKWTQEQYEDWRKNQLLYADTLAEIRDTLASDLHNVDKIAMQMVRDKQVDVYALNHNYGTYQVEHESGVDTSYSLYDHATVERLMKENPNLLPPPSAKRQAEIDAKDLKWNKEKLNSAFTASILSGDSIPEMAKKISQVADMDEKAAVRNARTMATGAENAGRLDSYKRSRDMGIKLKKQWMATNDGRTRESHAEADGQIVGIDDVFELKYGELEYPGDPAGPPAEVYNCRCTMVTEFDGFDFSNTAESTELSMAPEYTQMSFEDWSELHEQGRSGLSAGGTQTGVPVHQPPDYVRHIDSPDEDEISEMFDDFESEYVTEDIEHALVVTKGGDVYHCYGTLRNVYPDFDLGDELNGAKVTHTHPASVTEYSFSREDLSFFQKNNLETLRGADVEYRYILTRNDKAVDEQINVFDMTDRDYRHAECIIFAENEGVGYRRIKHD